MKHSKLIWGSLGAAAILAGCVAPRSSDSGFTKLFDGQSLKGWTLEGRKGDGYGVTNGVIYCAKGGGGKLITEREYSDFVFRFEFKLAPGANNGVGIRAPRLGDAAYLGMEIQILDEAIPPGAPPRQLRPEQFHGSIYNVLPAKRGALKPAGEWNTEEITAIGRNIKVVVNGVTVLDTDLNQVTDAALIRKHPGLFRERGHIGFLGHNDYVEFRNIRIKDLGAPEQDNVPPAGFVALFNGKDLTGWKGLLKGPNDNPIKRAALSPAEHQAAQKLADEDMRTNWKVANGQIVFSGKGRSLCTAKDYADFELLVDWKVPAHGDSGIYLRGTPQVQIWDPHTQPTKHGSEVGSGAFYNNKKNPSQPLMVADKPIGEWNRFRILMVGERAHVFLNGELVTRDTVLENYWDRSQPLLPSGQIELQNHGDGLEFKNIYIRELPAK
jgi:hypothetical protein